MLIIGPLRAWYLREVCTAPGTLSISRRYVVKMALLLGVVAAAVTLLVDTAVQMATSAAVQPNYVLTTAVAESCAAVLAVFMTWFEHHCGRRHSELVSTYLLGLSFGAIVKAYVLGRHVEAGTAEAVPTAAFFAYAGFAFAAFWASLFIEPSGTAKPVDSDESGRPCPEQEATLLSDITFSWMNETVLIGYRRPLERSDLYDLSAEDRSEGLSRAFHRTWARELRRKAPSLVRALFVAFGSSFMVAGLFKIIQDTLNFVSPLLLNLLIDFVEDPAIPQWQGYIYSGLLFLTAFVQSIMLHQYFQRAMRVGMRLRSAVIGAVYRKALVLSASARQTSTVGEIVNLMSIDAQRFQDLTTYLHMLWSAPYQIALSLYFLYNTMGISTVAGVGMMILMIPLNGVVASRTRKLQVEQMRNKDKRIKLMNEVLNGVKVIKLYAWEKPFLALLHAVRGLELNVLKRAAYLNSVATFLWASAPFLVALATFALYSLLGNTLTAQKAFVALALFNILQFPLSILPQVIAALVEAAVSVSRLRKFLLNDELDPNVVERAPRPALASTPSARSAAAPMVEIEDGRFAWSPAGNDILSDVNLRVDSGTLVAIVGRVGMGKSSLMSALLGDMHKRSGRVRVCGSVAYVPQQAWILNATLRDNVLFGQPYDRARYNTVIKACALEPDLAMLPAGDRTEIGEKGINLSGGQKQRVSLARAIYQDADVYLLDDPLSAVDAHVGRQLFLAAIGPRSLLRHKARLLVTHSVRFLPHMDAIFVLQNGRIRERGTYNQLVEARGEFAQFLADYSAHDSDNASPGDTTTPEELPAAEEPDTPAAAVEASGRPTRAARAEDAAVSADRRDYGTFSDATSLHDAAADDVDGDDGNGVSAALPADGAMHRVSSRTPLLGADGATVNTSKMDLAPSGPAGGSGELAKLISKEGSEVGNVKFTVYWDYAKSIGIIMSVTVILLSASSQGFLIGNSIWLSVWTSDASSDPQGVDAAVGKYLGVYAALGVCSLILTLIGALVLSLGSVYASRVLHSRMLGNVLRAPMAFFDTTPIGRIINRFSKDIYVIDESIPMAMRSFLGTFFRVVSVIIVICYSTYYFLAVIVPLLILYVFIQRFYVATSRQLRRLDSVSRSPIYAHFSETLAGVSSIRAYMLRERSITANADKVDENQIAYYPGMTSNRWLAVRLEFLGNCIVLFASLFAVIQRSSMDPGIVGLSVSYAMSVTQALNWMVRMTSDLETNIVAVERVREYCETPTEAPDELPDRRPPAGWPTRGEVVFDHYSTRYRPGLDLVLRDVSLRIYPAEKLGVCGRTGAGKSSLTLALFRIIEPASGRITIDGVDIAVIGLADLRSQLTIIPQDPVLFSGSIRQNLDPFDEHDDASVWMALERSHLKAHIQAQPDGLASPVSEGGENFSVGQRQLVCLARALLRRSKVLVLDEATAAIDLETDNLVQTAIRREFADCTVITIAHRLNTIMDSDRYGSAAQPPGAGGRRAAHAPAQHRRAG